MRYFAIVISLGLLMSSPDGAKAQTVWKREAEPTRASEAAFHATQAIVLPTTQVVGKRMMLFEISHRFIPRIKDGHEVLWGLDGPANIRFGFGFGLSEQVMVTLGRSNLYDNYDLTVKYGGVTLNVWSIPLELAVQAGGAWNTSVADRQSGDNRNFQYFGQGIVNVVVGRRVAIGVVPSYLYNIDIFSEDTENQVSLGTYGSFRTTDVFHIISEWNLVKGDDYYQYDAFGFGIELETGGHFFKAVATNSTSLSIGSYLPGALQSTEPKNWHLGFLVTRLLKL